jgi:hypothetical protein
MDTQISINGPNNFIKLSNGIKDIIIFGDFHLDFNNQNKCEFNINNEFINFDQFLLKFMSENKITEYDLFIESDLHLLYKSNNNVNHKYINNIRNIFSKNIKFENNKIIKSKKYNNFRFHYFDFRDDLDEFVNSLDLFENIPKINNNYNIDLTINLINEIKNNIVNFKNKIKKNKHKFIKKIFVKYENKDIQKIINKIIDKYFLDDLYIILIKNIDELLEFIYENYDNFKNKYLSFDFKIELLFEIHKKIDLIISIFYRFFLLCDLYLIRRILDKKYTKKNIIYTGVGHMLNIVNLLVIYFNFDIIKINYLSNKIKNIQEFKQLILTNTNFNQLENYIYNINDNDEINQCIITNSYNDIL